MALGRAFIEIHADTRPFGRELRVDIDKYLADADKRMGRGGQKVGRSFTDGVSSEVRRGLKDVVKEIDKLEPVTRRGARRAARALSGEMRKGESDAARGLSRFTSLVGNTLLSFFSSSLKNAKDWGNGISGLLSGAAENIQSTLALVLGISALVFAGLSAAIPLIAALAGSLVLLGSAVASVALAFAPLLVIFKGLSPILTKLTEGTKQWHKDLKTINPVLRPLAEVLRSIAKTFGKLPIGPLLKGIMGPLKAFQGFISSKSFAKAWRTLGKDAAQFLGAIAGAFQNKAGREAFTAWVKETGDILRVFGPAVGKVLGAFVTVFNDPGFQHAVGSIASIIANLVSQFADWLTQASKDGSLDTFFNNVLMIVQDLVNLLPAVGAFLAPFLTPGSFDALNSLLNMLINSLETISSLLGSSQGQQTIKDFTGALKWLIYWVIGVIAIFVALDTAIHSVWNFMKKVPGWIKSAWGGIEGFFSGLWNSIELGMSDFFNSIIDGINQLIDLLNKLPFVHLGHIGHVHWGTHINNHGKHAKGAGGGGGSGGGRIIASANGNYFDRPALTTIAEGGKPEVVIPLTKPERARALADKTGLTRMLTGERDLGDVYVFVGNEPVDARVERAMNKTASKLKTGARD